jgi:hypothetical protein
MLHDLGDPTNNYTIDQVVSYYSSLNILEDLTLLQRYNYNISVLDADLGNEEGDGDGEGEGEGGEE